MTTNLIPRREERHLLPFSSVMLKAELFTKNFCHLGYLWDVSPSGACLCFSEEASAIANDEPLQVRFLWSENDQTITAPCRIAWLNSVHGASFVGVELSEAMDLSQTFFSNLLNPRVLHPATSPN